MQTVTTITCSASVCSLTLALLIYFITFHVPTSLCDSNPPYVPSEHIALNCGSPSSATPSNDGRNWTGDIGSEFLPSTADNNSAASRASSIDPAVPQAPYGTARLFHSKITYTFNVTPGWKFVRLFFYPSSYMGLDASQAFLTVTASAGGYTLLRNFSASLTAGYLKSPFLVREFIVYVNGKALDLAFAPSSNASDAYAFVNGIEVVSMPPDLYFRGGAAAGPHLVGHGTLFYIDSTFALETCYRVDVGGDEIKPMDDTGMFRGWTNDDQYIYGAAAGIQPYDFRKAVACSPNLPPYTAPQTVYQTARAMGPYSNINVNYNLSWFFPVDSGFFYLVRLHFCEVQEAMGKVNERVFSIFINSQTAEQAVDVIAWSGGYGVPVYQDYVVNIPERNEGEKLDLRLELHPDTKPRPKYMDAILNGAEIFKISNYDGNLGGLNPPSIRSAPGGVSLTRQPSKSSKRTTLVITGCLLGGLLLLLLLICFLVFRFKMIKKGIDYPRHGGGVTDEIFASPLCHKFSIREIRAATDEFSEELVIGIGGFGKVYRGCFNGGATRVAVKRGSPMADQGFREFQTEIEMLSRLRHHNLVSLAGYCTEDGEMILVYDYMPKGSLYDHLHTWRTPLNWEQRLKICIGAARGLHYLHTGGSQKIIHRDVKTTNILLDDNWVGKVSDFGLSKLGSAATSNVTAEVKGSVGYLDPEYYRRHKLTEKSDVYSLGVVLLEVLCARPAVNVNPIMEDEHANLADWALCHCQNGSVEQIMDVRLQGSIAPESLAKFVGIAKACLAERGAERPSTGEVLWNLELALQLQIRGEAGQVPREPNYNHSSDVAPGIEFSEIMFPAPR